MQPERLTHPKYRPDIDGLRAVAVLSVVAFHAFPGVVRGGFVGVDIFFVISGYLISTIILSNLARDSFSFAEFYSRRIRRIFPALAVVLAFCLGAGWFWLLAEEYQALGKHVAGGAGFISNLLLWRESGYFDPAAELKPLLHLWSLGIEEQFYIVWPLLLWLVAKRKLSVWKAIVLFAAVSFAFNIVTFRKNPVANFYSPQSRFWELLIGAGLAAIDLNREAFAMRAGIVAQRLGLAHLVRLGRPDALSLAGAGLIVLAIAVLSKTRHFPGFWALLPTFGAALMMFAGPHAWCNRHILSHPVVVWFGLISFPLYLWHWPLLALPHIIETETPAAEVRAGAVALSVLLAWLTYRFIERPLRFGDKGTMKAVALAVVMAGIAGLGLALYAAKGLPGRAINNFGAVKLGFAGHGAFFDHMAGHFHPCASPQMRDSALAYEGRIRCFQSRPDLAVDAVLLGDSHAEHLFPGLAEALPGRNLAYYIQAATPVMGVKDYDKAFAVVLADAAIRTVILAGHWKTRSVGLARGLSFETELARTLSALRAAGKQVYLVDDIPDFSFQPTRCKAMRLFGPPRPCAEPEARFATTTAAYLPALERAAASAGVRLLRIGPAFCGNGVCTMERTGALLYRDENHVNLAGSRFVAGLILDQAPDLAPPPDR